MSVSPMVQVIVDIMSPPNGTLVEHFDSARVSYNDARQRLVDRVQQGSQMPVESEAIELELLIDLMKAESDLIIHRRINLIAGKAIYRHADIERCRTLMHQLSAMFDDHDPTQYERILDSLAGR